MLAPASLRRMQSFQNRWAHWAAPMSTSLGSSPLQLTKVPASRRTCHANSLGSGPPKENQNHITATLAEPIQTRNLNKWFVFFSHLLLFVPVCSRDVSRSHWLPCPSGTCCNAVSLIVVTQIAIQCATSQLHQTAPVPILHAVQLCGIPFHVLRRSHLPRNFMMSCRYYSAFQHPLVSPDHHQINPSLPNRVSANFPGNFLLIYFLQPSEPLAASTHRANDMIICSPHLLQPI